MAKTTLISMKRTPEDMRKDMGETAPVTSIAPDYPYGLCIHLDKDELDKLGMRQLPDVGSEFPICASVRVTCVRKSAVEGADEETSVDLQITAMAVDAGD